VTWRAFDTVVWNTVIFNAYSHLVIVVVCTRGREAGFHLEVGFGMVEGCCHIRGSERFLYSRLLLLTSSPESNAASHKRSKLVEK
jgi:hypothetical protein